jgi:hypothetical protein
MSPSTTFPLSNTPETILAGMNNGPVNKNTENSQIFQLKLQEFQEEKILEYLMP